jgi:hypothetical protein
LNDAVEEMVGFHCSGLDIRDVVSETREHRRYQARSEGDDYILSEI